MKKKCAFVTGGTNNQFFAMATLAINLQRICKNMADELIIFTEQDVAPEEQKKVNSIFPTIFILYESPFENLNSLNAESLRNFSKMVFCKYECFKLLDEYETLIWTDYDVVILKSMDELKKQFNQHGDIVHAKFLESNIIAGKFDYKLYWHNYREVLSEMNISAKAMAAGLFVLYDTFPNYNEFYTECINLTIKYAEWLILPEEAVISVLLDKHKIKWESLNEHIWACHPRLDSPDEETKILHAAWHPKFWEDGLNNELWNNMYEEWCSKYNGQTIPKIVVEQKKITMIKIIKYLLPYGIVRFVQRWKVK